MKNKIQKLGAFLSIAILLLGGVALAGSFLHDEKSELEIDLAELAQDISELQAVEDTIRTQKERKIRIAERKNCILADLKIEDGEEISKSTAALCGLDFPVGQ